MSVLLCILSLTEPSAIFHISLTHWKPKVEEMLGEIESYKLALVF